MALPTNYTAPVSSSKGDGYMNKFEVGENRIRILSEIVPGFQWTVDPEGKAIKKGVPFKKGDKPVRVHTFKEAVAAPEGAEAKHFWAMVVWNYKVEKIQILMITQPSIQKDLQGYEKDPDWGDLNGYDLVIVRTGKDFTDTRYQVMPKPAKPVTAEIQHAYEEKEIDLEKLFTGENPFGDTAQKMLTDAEVEEVNEETPF